MNDILIFNSEENYSNGLCIKINEEELIFDKVTIWFRRNEFIEISAYTNDVILIDKFQLLISDLNKNQEIYFYPNIKETNTFFTFNIINKNIFENKNLLGSTKIFNIYCFKECDLLYEDEKYENFCDSYSKISTDIYLNQEERDFVQKIMKDQLKEHWFNDQNILIENEYKRILNILNQTQIAATGKVFDPSVLKIINGPSDPMFELSKITGLENVKHEIEKLKYNLEYQNKRTDRGMTNEKSSMHMCFYGNPGTGKTTIARIMTGLLYEMGYIKKNRCVEVNGLELKGTHIGQTATITKGILDYAKGGVLFIDEAYTLYDENEKDFGKEAVNTFLKEMEDSRTELIIIFAGYKKPMDRLLDTNAGFRSRIKKYFDFEDYNTLELTNIFINLLRNRHLFITQEALEKAIFIIKNARKKQSFGNGRYVNNLIEHIEELHILNVENCEDYSRIDTIEIEDIEDVTEL